MLVAWPERALVSLLLVAGLATAGFGPPVITDGGFPPLRMDADQVRQQQKLALPPHITAASALVVDVDSGRTLYAVRPRDRMPPASTAKLMTALLTLQRAKLDDQVKVSQQAAGTTGSRMGLAAGEVLTVKDLMYGLLLPSGNDAAVALAEHVAGSEAQFVALMNDTAASLGMMDTHYVNPHGQDDPAQVTSAGDLITVAQADLAYPVFAEIVSTKNYQAAGHPLSNTNELLGAYRGADGVKTGTTDAAGECLVASVTRDGHRLLVAELGSKDRYADARALLSYAAEGWRWQPAALPDNALSWTTGPDGRAYRLRTEQPAQLFLPAWQWPLAAPVVALSTTVPLSSTTPVGTLSWIVGGQVLTTMTVTTWLSP
jgi:D-alanyl-D-alanine carboxypeptidase